MKFGQFTKECKQVEDKKQTFTELIKKLNIKTYIPLKEKMEVAKIIKSIVNPINFDEGLDGLLEKNIKEEDEIYINYEVYKILFVLSKYLSVDISIKDCTESNYDLLSKVGIKEYIVEQCCSDYKEFYDFIDNYTGMKYIGLTNNIYSILCMLPTQKDLESISHIFDSFDEKKLKNIVDVVAFNNPSYTKFYEETLKSVNK